MAGPIQTAIGQALGAAAAAGVVAKKLSYDERQASQAKEKEEKAEAEAQRMAKEQIRAEDKEASAVALEADLINMGASPEAAKAYRLAQERGLGKPQRLLFDESGKPLATYEEVATILSMQAKETSLSARLRGKDKVKARREMLEGRSHEERVHNAVLASSGGKK